MPAGIADAKAVIPAIRQRRLFIRAKEAGRPCEDVVLGWPRHGRFAVSDGASISYDSRGWARALCWQFMRNTNVGPEWLDHARARFAARSVAPEDDWAASHASSRGSFATFLGFTITDAALVVHAIGDTAVFVVSPNGRISMFPEMTTGDFSGEPSLLCSIANRSAFADNDEAFAGAQSITPAPPEGWTGARLIALTDALAEWVVRSKEPAEQLAKLDLLAGQPDRVAFAAWATEAIAVGQVRRDDCTMLLVGL